LLGTQQQFPDGWAVAHSGAQFRCCYHKEGKQGPGSRFIKLIDRALHPLLRRTRELRGEMRELRSSMKLLAPADANLLDPVCEHATTKDVPSPLECCGEMRQRTAVRLNQCNVCAQVLRRRDYQHLGLMSVATIALATGARPFEAIALVGAGERLADRQAVGVRSWWPRTPR
jgi:hypothetical protein